MTAPVPTPDRRIGRRRHQRRSGTINAAVTVAILAVVATVALTATPTPPPAIAEFAPQPLKQNKQVQSELSTNVGKGTGGTGNAGGLHGGRVTPRAAVPTLPPITVPGSTHTQCVGDPPRQIEDPQSPPCIPPWQGNNEGATSRGVSKDSIKVFWVRYGTDTFMPDYAAFFNARFQLYGRSIQFVSSDVYGSGNEGGQTNDEAGQRALANDAAASKVFASTYWTDNGGYFYSDQASRDKIVNVVSYETPLRNKDFQSYAPYAWGYTMAADPELSEIGSWMCARFAGKAVSHAPVYNGQPRKYGIILRPADDHNKVDTNTLDSKLAKCGVKPEYFKYPDVSSTQTYDATLQQMRSDGITTVLCLCWYVDGNDYIINAGSLGYAPEWLLTSFGEYDDDWNFRWAYNQPASESANVMGLSFHPRINKVVNEPFWWAVKAVDPGATQPTVVSDIWYAQGFYREMLLLASGMQMAGPNLTPETFQAGLQKAQFPNPDTPLMAGHVGFGGGSHTMTVDATEYYYDPSARSPYDGDAPGAICYVAGGRRRGPDDWADARDDPFHKGTCDSAR